MDDLAVRVDRADRIPLRAGDGVERVDPERASVLLPDELDEEGAIRVGRDDRGRGREGLSREVVRRRLRDLYRRVRERCSVRAQDSPLQRPSRHGQTRLERERPGPALSGFRRHARAGHGAGPVRAQDLGRHDRDETKVGAHLCQLDAPLPARIRREGCRQPVEPSLRRARSDRSVEDKGGDLPEAVRVEILDGNDRGERAEARGLRSDRRDAVGGVR